MSGVQVKKVENATLYEAPILVSKDGKRLDNVYPAQSVYPTKRGQTFNEIGVLGHSGMMYMLCLLILIKLMVRE